MIDNNTQFRIVGIDPGTVTLGFAVLCINTRTLEVEHVIASTMNSKHMRDTSLTQVDSVVNLVDRHYNSELQKNNLISLLEYHRPAIVLCETPFINRFRPQAYGALTEIMEAIRSACKAYDQDVPFVGYAPARVKKTVGAFALGGKADVYEAIRNIKELNSNINIDMLTEHDIDAIAVAYTYLTRLRSHRCRNRTV